MTLTIQDWAALLDQNPWDALTLNAYADWLEERDTAPRAAALRHLLDKGHMPGVGPLQNGDWIAQALWVTTPAGDCWRWSCLEGWDHHTESRGRDYWDPAVYGSKLPKDFYHKLCGDYRPPLWKTYASYHEAVDAYLNALLTQRGDGP